MLKRKHDDTMGAESPSSKKKGKTNDDRVRENARRTQTQLTSYAVADKGKKKYLEDMIAISDLNKVEPGLQSLGLRLQVYAVYDGHGGLHSSTYLKQNLHKNLAKELVNSKPEGRAKAKHIHKWATKALAAAFKKTDKALMAELIEKKIKDGSCCVFCLVLDETVFICNVGDSKAVLARRKGAKIKGVRLTKDHSPLLKKEKERIKAAGGFVSPDGRVCDSLAVSRSFGDVLLKRKGLSSTPDIVTFPLSAECRFLLLACDGLWGVFSPEDAVQFCEKNALLANQWELDHPVINTGLLSQKAKESTVQIVARKTCQKLIREAVLTRGAVDNTSAIVIMLNE